MQNRGMTSVAVAGASGYAGGEILRLLLGHPAYSDGRLAIGALTAAGSAGTLLGSTTHTCFRWRIASSMPPTSRRSSGHDVVFLGLPHGTRPRWPNCSADDTLMIDCGADFRLTDAGRVGEVLRPAHAGSWPYGLPELPGNRDILTGATRIAVPGCYPTAALLALLPAVAAGIVGPQSRSLPSAARPAPAGPRRSICLASEVIGSARAYDVGGMHRHTPEIIQDLSAVATATSGLVHPGADPRCRGASSRPAPRGRRVASRSPRGATKRRTVMNHSSLCCRKASCPRPVR